MRLSVPTKSRNLLYRYSIPLPEIPTYKVQPEAMTLKNDYNPVFPTGKTIVTYGEYNVGGVIRQIGKGAIIGSGSQDNLIGLGVLNSASIGYMHQFNPRLKMEWNVNTTKFSSPGYFNQSVGLSGNLRYKLADRLTLNTFGSYDKDLSTKFAVYNFGASVEMDATEKFGLEAGAQTFYDNWSRRWQTMPIVRPYYKISDDCKIGFDFGPIIKDAIQNAVMKGGNNYGPTIMPPNPWR